MKKLGFTMVELLLCIAIIGVVSAMGMTITKHSTDKAYNLYFYYGYINLYNSIADMIAEGEGVSIAGINRRLGTSEELPEDRIVRTINGVTYQMEDGFSNIIRMEVPQKKTRNNEGKATVRLQYLQDGDGYLIPLTAGSDVNLQERRDLLPAYVDDGIVGRVKRNDDNYSIERQIPYYTYRQAYCSIKDNESIIEGPEENPVSILTCPAPGGLSDQIGVLKVADPRKAR